MKGKQLRIIFPDDVVSYSDENGVKMITVEEAKNFKQSWMIAIGKLGLGYINSMQKSANLIANNPKLKEIIESFPKKENTESFEWNLKKQ